MTMGWVAAGIGVAGIGAGLIGGSMQADAAEDAANIQAGSANQANQLQYQMFQEQQKLMQPWVQSGQGSLERLNYAMYGQTPTTDQMRLDPSSQVYKDYVAANSLSFPVGAGVGTGLGTGSGPTLYQNPLTGEISQTPPQLSGDQFGVQAGGLSPDYRFSTQDWKNSPEYSVYQGARDAALQRSQDALMAQNAASGMYGSGTMANQLSQNMGQLYAQYDPQSLAAAQSNAVAARQNQYQQMAGMASPTGAQQVGQWAQNYGQIAGQNTVAAGNAQAAGQMGAANAWGNAITSGVNQVANAYGQYQGQQNFNQLAQMYAGGYTPQYSQPTPYGQTSQYGGGTFYGNMPQY